MRKVEILKEAIDKAIGGGWSAEGLDGVEVWQELPEAIQEAALHTFVSEGMGNGYALLVFEHDFAKALWGASWKHHLQQMVVAEDRFGYLAVNAGKGKSQEESNRHAQDDMWPEVKV